MAGCNPRTSRALLPAVSAGESDNAGKVDRQELPTDFASGIVAPCQH